MKSTQRLLATAAVVLMVFTGAACKSDPDKLAPDNPFRPQKSERELRLEAAQLYKLGRENLEASDFDAAIQRYDQLSTRYPFTDYATQGELEKVYALYRGFDSDKALSAADKFLREHPRHAAVDYVQYLKGLINFDRDKGFSDMLPLDTSKKDIGFQRRAFDDFGLLVQKYPNSKYVGDARQRMIFLRNRIADHELSVVKFYVSRGAYVAAARRAEQIVEQYPGAPATVQALELLQLSYTEAGLKQQADDVALIRSSQPAGTLSLPDAVGREHDQNEAPRKPGFFGWFGSLFSSEDDSGIEIVIPTAKAETPAPAAADAASAEKSAEAEAPKSNSSKLRLTMEPYDDAASAPPPEKKE